MSEYESNAGDDMHTMRSEEAKETLTNDVNIDLATLSKEPSVVDATESESLSLLVNEPGNKKKKQIFCLKSKSVLARDRFAMKAQDYMESYKMGIYLQDAIKLILDRREEKPLELLNSYFNTALKGEHILLREYAFVSTT